MIRDATEADLYAPHTEALVDDLASGDARPARVPGAC